MRKYANELQYHFESIDTVAFDKILERIGEQEIILYGAGEQGKRCYSYLLLKEIAVRCFVDGNENLSKDTPFFTRIISPQELHKIYNGETIIITPYMQGLQIRESLLNAGFSVEKLIMLPFSVYCGVARMPNFEQHEADDLEYAKESVPNSPITVLSFIYNTPEHYLRRAIESVLDQTHRNFKYLIIDHASNDGITSSIIREYSELDARIEVIKTETNYFNEIHAKRIPNVLALYDVIEQHIKTDYVCGLDSDDYIEDTYLEKTYHLAVKNNADVVTVSTLMLYDDEIANNRTSLWTRPYYSDTAPLSNCIADNERSKWLWYSVTKKIMTWWSGLLKRDVYLYGAKFQLSHEYGYVTSDFYQAHKYAEKAKTIVFHDELLFIYTCKAQRKVSQGSKVRNDIDRVKASGIHAFLHFFPHLRDKLSGAALDADKYMYNMGVMLLRETYVHAECAVRDHDNVEIVSTILSELMMILSDDYAQRLVNSSSYLKNTAQKIIGDLYMRVNSK